MTFTVRPGKPHPLGATHDPHGVNFALFSEHATGVTLCLFDDEGRETQIQMSEHTAYVWHAYVVGAHVGQRYGYRVDGPFDPGAGHRFNRNKLLLDPYARQVVGEVTYDRAIFAVEEKDEARVSSVDSAPFVPRGVVTDSHFDWEGDAPLDIPWAETVVYEAHVKGLTARHPLVHERNRGTYLGACEPAIVEHLKRIGVTAIEFLPLHQKVDEEALRSRGLTNYWGYSTLSYFAPDRRFASRAGDEVIEFKRMVRELHKAKIEVILDVVYNHSGEGDRFGPTLSLRGIDNRSYYRLQPGNLAEYEDFSGCGNTLNMHHPQTIKLVMDSLRYWVSEMHVDGFRFDLAPALAREVFNVDRLSAFFDIIHQDPLLSRVKLIAEPWDLGEGGYQVGNFPVLWNEWNGRFRDSVRRFWIGNESDVRDMGYRLTGSSDLFGDDGRQPHASVNFITAHDGFTLRDLVSYETKHNEANGEENRDGANENLSWNCGVEGETSDPAVRAVRLRQMRNLLATLFLSQGVPMLTSGDEIGKTQKGNNNAYAQDNATSWLDWKLDHEANDLLQFTSRLAALRKEHAVFRHLRFFRGAPLVHGGMKDLAWFTAEGKEMTEQDWSTPRALLGLLVSGDSLECHDSEGHNVVDDSFLVFLCAAREPMRVTLPAREWGEEWQLELDTSITEKDHSDASRKRLLAGDAVEVGSLSLQVWKRVTPIRGSWRPFRRAQRA